MLYVVGQTVYLGPFTFKDSNGTLVDPSPTPTVAITLPNGTAAPSSPFNLAKDSTGVYHYLYTPSATGIHQYYSSGTVSGAVAESIPDVFTVAPTTTAAIISLADAKETLNKLAGTATLDDGEILLMVRAATELVNELADYTVATSITETVDSTVDQYGRVVIILSHVPVMTVQTITSQIDGTTVTVDAANLDIQTGEYILSNSPGCWGPQKVTYTAGRANVPAALQQACRLELQSLWQTQRGGAAAGAPFGGQEADTTQDDLPYRVLQLVQRAGSKRPGGVA